MISQLPTIADLSETVIRTCLSAVFNSLKNHLSSETVLSSLSSLGLDQNKLQTTCEILAASLLESISKDYSNDDFEELFDSHNVPVSIRSVFVEFYNVNKESLQNTLSLSSHFNPVLRGVNWKLDCVVDGSCEASDPLEYTIELNTCSGPISFTARPCELADIVEKLRTAVMRAEKGNF
ncbi:hypothetical protein RCL1_005236 [Eukaryota sp. TZLM3-RCL]